MMRARARRMRAAVTTLLVVALVGATLATGSVSAAAPQPGPATLKLDPATAVAPASMPRAAADKLAQAPRARFVALDTSTLRTQLSASTVVLPVFPDVNVPLVADGPIHKGAGDSLVWSGTAKDGGYATLTFTGDTVRADVAYEGTRYDLTPTGGTRHLVTVEQRDFRPEIAAPVPQGGLAPSSSPTGSAADASTDANPVIRVLTLYDDYAISQLGGTDQSAQDELAATINEVNAAYARSGVHQTIQSAGIQYVSHQLAPDSFTDLMDLTGTTDGILDGIHTTKWALGADLVSLVTGLSDACGIAWLPPETPSAATNEYAYSVVDATCARGNLSYAHELGHNMGAGHGGGSGGGLYSYSNGYLDPEHGFRTIMAYPTCACTRVAYFSNTTAQYAGWPIGSPAEDNARTLNETGAGIAAYRGTAGAPPPNDAFAAAIPLTGYTTGTNVSATKEPGEPNHAGNSGGASVWWTYTPGADAVVTISTTGSNYDTLLAVYTGATVSTLTGVVANDDSNGTLQSEVTFVAAAGVPYRVAVDGYNSQVGAIVLSATATPIQIVPGQVAVTEGPSGTQVVQVPVTLSVPSNRTVSASWSTIDISARAPGDYTAASGTLTFAPGETAKSIAVRVKGDGIDEADEAFAVALTDPVHAQIGGFFGLGVVTIVDDDPLPVITPGAVTVQEGSGGTRTAQVPVTLSAPSGRTVTASWTTGSWSAVAPADFEAATGTVTFAPGETTKTVAVTVQGDTLDEPDELALVGFSNPTNATVGGFWGLGFLSITDDDPAPQIVPGSTTTSEGSSGLKAVQVPVSLSAVSGKTVTVSWSTANWSATTPADYAAASGTVTFAPGETVKTVTVSVRGDTVAEPNELFVVSFTNPTNATGGGLAGVTITNDD